ncbi:phosphatase PAP2 family protein [Hydrogenophaga sp. 5NK40-0174]
MLLAIAWDLSGLDIQVAHLAGTPDGFPLQHAWWAEHILHHRWRQVSLVGVGLLGLWAFRPGLRTGQRLERRTALTLVVLCVVSINIIKWLSSTSCPWSLAVFGGEAQYVSHWALGAHDGGSGRCFPSGHATTAFGFLPLGLLWIAPLSDTKRKRSTGWRWMAGCLLLGAVAGTTQVIRGAHYPSHVVWTGVICAGISLTGWHWQLARLRPKGLTTPVRDAREGTQPSLQ